MAISLQKVKRLHGMVRAAIPEGKLDGNRAPALTSAYASLRSQIVDSLEGDIRSEFEAFFPELPEISPPGGSPRDIAIFTNRYTSAAEGAATKLRLLDGWLNEFISESARED